MFNNKNDNNKVEVKEKKKPDLVNRIISVTSSLIGVACILFTSMAWLGFVVIGVGLISNIIYEAIKSKKGGSD